MGKSDGKAWRDTTFHGNAKWKWGGSFLPSKGLLDMCVIQHFSCRDLIPPTPRRRAITSHKGRQSFFSFPREIGGLLYQYIAEIWLHQQPLFYVSLPHFLPAPQTPSLSLSSSGFYSKCKFSPRLDKGRGRRRRRRRCGKVNKEDFARISLPPPFFFALRASRAAERSVIVRPPCRE